MTGLFSGIGKAKEYLNKAKTEYNTSQALKRKRKQEAFKVRRAELEAEKEFLKEKAELRELKKEVRNQKLEPFRQAFRGIQREGSYKKPVVKINNMDNLSEGQKRLGIQRTGETRLGGGFSYELGRKPRAEDLKLGKMNDPFTLGNGRRFGEDLNNKIKTKKGRTEIKNNPFEIGRKENNPFK